MVTGATAAAKGMTMEEDGGKEGGGVAQSWRSQSSGYDCDDNEDDNGEESHSSSRCRRPPPSRIVIDVDVVERRRDRTAVNALRGMGGDDDVDVDVDADADVVDGGVISTAAKNDGENDGGDRRPSPLRVTFVDDDISAHWHRRTHLRVRSSPPPPRPQCGSAGRRRGRRARHRRVGGRSRDTSQSSGGVGWGGGGRRGKIKSGHNQQSN